MDESEPMSAPAPPDYTQWSHADLLNRVTALEAQLRAQTALVHNSTTPARRQETSSSTKHTPKKPKKTFDPSRYHTRFIALKFAYLGGNYNGFEHHNNNTTPLPTIEEELFKALWKTRLIFPEYKTGQKEGSVCWEGTEYSKCGRTDRGVSAFGQVVGIRVRSSRPKEKKTASLPRSDDGDGTEECTKDNEEKVEKREELLETKWDPISDELPYIHLLNRVLPPDIRILAWCADPPGDFSARFSCRERRYRYFFSNPAYTPSPLGTGEGWLDIEAMREAAGKYEGLHDFQNLCKIDPSKQITNFQRRIFHAGIHEVDVEEKSGLQTDMASAIASPKFYYFEVRGSAFLWHQVRHLVAILFLVGQGYEQPSIVDELLNVQSMPNRPVYRMASDAPLVLWDCIFPQASDVVGIDHGLAPGIEQPFTGYEDALDWIYIGDDHGGGDNSKRVTPGVDDGKYGRNGIMDDLWALWRKRKIDELLAGSLLKVVSIAGPHADHARSFPEIDRASVRSLRDHSDRVFDGSEQPPAVGTYIPLLQRKRMETPAVVNARYASRKGLDVLVRHDDDAEE